jgi:hypothetical protein
MNFGGILPRDWTALKIYFALIDLVCFSYASSKRSGLLCIWGFLEEECKISFPIGLSIIHAFGMENWTIEKLKEKFLRCLFHWEIVEKETSSWTPFFSFLCVGLRQMCLVANDAKLLAAYKWNIWEDQYWTIIYLLNSFPMLYPNSFGHAFLCVSRSSILHMHSYKNPTVFFQFVYMFDHSCISKGPSILYFGPDLNKCVNAACTKTFAATLSFEFWKWQYKAIFVWRKKKGLSIIHVLLAIRCIALDKCGVWIIENLTTTSAW